MVVDGQGIPLGSHTASASPAEITLLEAVIEDIKVPKKGPGRPRTRPKRVIGDKGYDSDWFREALESLRIQPCIPGRSGRKEPVEYDQQAYKQRNRIERMFGRLKDWRRIATRYDRCAHTFMGAITVAAIVRALAAVLLAILTGQIGRASCRVRV